MVKPKTMQEMGEEFMMFLCMCITEWSNVETNLFDICKAILKTTQEHTAIIYYRTPTLDSRLELTTEIVGTVSWSWKIGQGVKVYSTV